MNELITQSPSSNGASSNGATRDEMRDCLSPEVVSHAANGHRPPALAKQGVDAISILDYVGNTPLFKFCSLTRHLKTVEVYGKAEYLNPGGSVKDRPALSMVLKGEREGNLTKDKIIIDSTSGNTGIAYAMIGAARGYRVQLVMPGNVSVERKNIVKTYGAELILSDPLKGSDGAIELAREIYAENPDKYFKPDQYNNEANSLAHYNGTGPEIWSQTRGRITHFFSDHRHQRHLDGHRSIFERKESRCLRSGRRTGQSDARHRRFEAHGIVDQARHLSSRNFRR